MPDHDHDDDADKTKPGLTVAEPEHNASPPSPDGVTTTLDDNAEANGSLPDAPSPVPGLPKTGTPDF